MIDDSNSTPRTLEFNQPHFTGPIIQNNASNGEFSTGPDYFIFTFDISNESIEPLKVKFDIYDGQKIKLILDDISDLPESSCTTVIHTGVTKRIILPIKKIELLKSVAEKPIPTPPWKQFIASKNSVLGETLRRALFWYRETIIGNFETRGRIVATWSCVHIVFKKIVK